MKFRSFFSYLICPFLVVAMNPATADEAWSFSEPSETALNNTFSDSGTPFAKAGSPIAFVQEGGLQFVFDGSTEHTFRQQAFAKGPVDSGIVELAWTFSGIDFSRTVAAGGSGNVGFDVRDLNGTLQSPKDDTVFGVLRLRCEKGGLLLQFSQSGGGANEWVSVASMETAQLEEPLKVRMRFDLDERAKAGAFQIFLKLGDADEVLALDDGTLSTNASISGFRIIQQTLNGKNSWAKGDTVTVDDFSVTYN